MRTPCPGGASQNRGYHRCEEYGLPREFRLQWVHGLRTVVIKVRRDMPASRNRASMGPRSENRGYPPTSLPNRSMLPWLQWVHGLRTVVIATQVPVAAGFRVLQWVHGLRTVV